MFFIGCFGCLSHRRQVSMFQTNRSNGSPTLAVNNSQPVSVTTIVCSNCADRDLRVHAVGSLLSVRRWVTIEGKGVLIEFVDKGALIGCVDRVC